MMEAALSTPTARTQDSLPVNIWRAITRPHPSITDVEMRRQSRLLAGLTFTLLVTSLVAAILLTAVDWPTIPDTVKRLIPVLALLTVYHLLNRSGRYRLAASLFLIQNFLTVHMFAAISGDTAWLQFASMNLILVALLMPVTVTRLAFVASLVFQVVLGRVAPSTLEVSNVGLFIVYMITASLVMVFMNHRNRLERDRQQELREANEKLRESERVLEIRVEDRTKELREAIQVAEAARVRAEEADRVKGQFVASMSHELRTPLNAILTFNELMAMGTFGEVNAEQVDYLTKSLNSGRHLLSLINDVLDITKIQSGMMKLFVEEDFDVISEMQTIASTAEKLLADKPVNLVVDVDHNFPPMACDKRRVRQVLLNLVANAVKFTEKGTITLSAKHMGDQALFAVIDTGPGIAREDIEIVFKPFVQTETGIRHQGGTGLGLPISERMVEAHGGKLWVDSVQGEGSSFFVRLPLKSALVMGESEMVRYVQ